MINYQINYQINHSGNGQRAGRRAGREATALQGQGPARGRAGHNPSPGLELEGQGLTGWLGGGDSRLRALGAGLESSRVHWKPCWPMNGEWKGHRGSMAIGMAGSLVDVAGRPREDDQVVCVGILVRLSGSVEGVLYLALGPAG